MQRQAGFIFNDDGPVLIELAARPSTTQPGRVKMAFVVEADPSLKLVEANGTEHAVPLPEEAEGKKMILGSEFRFECN